MAVVRQKDLPVDCDRTANHAAHGRTGPSVEGWAAHSIARWAVLALAWPWLAGCQWLTSPAANLALTETAAAASAPAAADAQPVANAHRDVLANSRWSPVPLPGDRSRNAFEEPDRAASDSPGTAPGEGQAENSGAGFASRPRWQHRGLEDLLAGPAAERPDFLAALGDSKAVVAANAAIALARLGDPAGVKVLMAAIRTTTHPLPMRCAAIEALAGLADQGDSLRELLQPYTAQQPSNGPAELHAELLRGLAAHARPEDTAILLPALASLNPKVRAEAVWTWSATGQADWPEVLTRLRSDRSPLVRIALLHLVAAQRHPQARVWLSAAVNDVELSVRLAAIAGLGQLGGPQSQALLLKTRQSGSDAMRAAAVTALARMNVRQAMPEATKDPCWRVRAVIAEALPGWADREGASLALTLLDDSSVEVQQRVLTSIHTWPLELAGPVFLAAMGKSGYSTRCMAAQRLAALWPPASEFPTETGLESRSESLSRLEQRFRQEVGFAQSDAAQKAIDQGQGRVAPSAETLTRTEQLLARLAASPSTDRQEACEALAALDADMIPVLECVVFQRQTPLPEIVYRELLPKRSPVFARIEELGQEDLVQRRAAAESLAELGQQQPLPRLALARLGTLMLRQSDTLIWRSALMAVDQCPGPEAAALAYAGCSHPNPEVRRRACQHLARHPAPRHVPVLVAALDDVHRSVVSAAIAGLGVQGTLNDPQPLQRLLAAPSESLRAEAALALARLGDLSGLAALDRLAYSTDSEIRRQVATALGEVGDSSSIATLVHLLDDRTAVRRAALESLPRVVGKNVAQVDGQPLPDIDRQALRWKQWWQQSSAAGDAELRR